MERNKITVILFGVILVIALAYNQATILTLRTQITQQTQRGDELSTTLSNTTKELSSKSDELSALQAQYGVAVSDKTKAEQEASTQKKAAASSASEAQKQKGIAEAASANYYYAIQAGSVVESQRDYYATATWYVADGVEKMEYGDYSGARAAFEFAVSQASAAKALDSTLNYWIGLIE